MLGRTDDYSLCVLGTLARLKTELLYDRFVLVLRLESHSSLLAFGALEFQLLLEKSVGDGCTVAATSLLLPGDEHLVPSVLNVDSQTLRG